MSRFIFFIIVGGLALAAILAVNVSIANAGEETKMIPVSVLAEDQADYSVDKNIQIIPAVSPDIIEDKARDLPSSQSTLPVFTYSPLKSEEPAVQPEDEETEIYIYRGEAVDKEAEKQEKQEQKETEKQEKQEARENTKKEKQDKKEDTKQDKGEDLDAKEKNADKK